MEIASKEIENYCKLHTTPLAPVFDALREETFAKTTAPQMQVGLLEGRFLGLLVSLTNAKRILEIGTFTGFSGLAMASALPEDGRLYTCDIDPRATEIAKKFWAQSEHGKKITLKLGPAAETIPQLDEIFDLVFIDADKAGYANYWDLALPKVKKGGLIVVDNVLWSGRILDPKEKSDREIHAFNQKAAQDPRVTIVMLTVRDGMLLALKK